MKKIGVVGANGFVGRSVCRNAKNFDLDLIAITRENYEDLKSDKYDFLINCACPSGKYWALNNPYLDFQQTVMLTADLVYNWNYDKIVQISTMSANEINNNHPYGINKRAAEIITLYKHSLVVRLGSLYGYEMKKGPLYDLLNSKRLYVDIKSEYNLIDVNFCTNWILQNLDKKGTVQLGAIDTISLLEISKKLGLDATYEGDAECIYSGEVENEMPSTKGVWDFIYNYIKK